MLTRPSRCRQAVFIRGPVGAGDWKSSRSGLVSELARLGTGRCPSIALVVGGICMCLRGRAKIMLRHPRGWEAGRMEFLNSGKVGFTMQRLSTVCRGCWATWGQPQTAPQAGRGRTCVLMHRLLIPLPAESLGSSRHNWIIYQ